MKQSNAAIATPGYKFAACAESEADEAMLRMSDVDGKGYFALGGLLKYTNETQTPEVAAYFNK